MITLKISFLVAIKLREKSRNKKAKKSKKGKRSSSKKRKGKSQRSKLSRSSKKSKSSKSDKKKKKQSPKLDTQDLFYITFDVKKPLCYARIDYEIFAKRLKFFVDIVCWGPIAKIYTAKGTKSLTTIIENDIAWIPVFVEHFLNPLSTQEVRDLLKQSLNFNIKFGKKSVGKSAKKDKPHTFYLEKDKVGQDFVEVSTHKPIAKANNENIEDEIRQILMKALNFPIQKEITSWVHSRDESHKYRIFKIIEKNSKGIEIPSKDFIDETEKTSKKGKNKNKKAAVKKKEKQKKAQHFKIPAQVFITDPTLAIYSLKNIGTNISDLFILLSSENILTLQQKYELNPLVLKIRKINNLPFNILKQNGFDKIFTHCNIPNIDNFKTAQKPISEIVRFDYSRLLCMNDFPAINLLHILETHRVIVEIFGVREIPRKVTLESLWKKTKKKKKRKTETKSIKFPTESIKISMATFDLSSLSKSYWLFKEKRQCQMTHSFFPKNRINLNNYFIDRLTINEVNTVLDENKPDLSPLSDDILIAKGTTLKFEANFLIPQFPSFYIKDSTTTYRRLLLIIFKEELAILLFNEILLYNHKFTGQGPLLISHLLETRNIFTSGYTLEQEWNNLLTGFFVDDGNTFIFYIEGLSTGFILKLIHQVSGYNFSTAKVFYNSEYLFGERLYLTFFKYNGLFVLTLKMSLCDIFAKGEIYIEGNVPIPCFKAIQKLHLLLNSSTFKSILNYDLLPTEIELLSFSMEFGFPLKYKAKDTDKLQLMKPMKSELFDSKIDLFGN